MNVHRHQMAAGVIFLGGVDKTLSMGCMLLYLAGKLDIKWLRGSKRMGFGSLTCNPGMTAKIKTLRELGMDFSEFQDLIDLRNYYIHDCEIHARYQTSVDFRRKRLALRARGPYITYSEAPPTNVTEADLRRWSRGIPARLGRFLDRNPWQGTWRRLVRALERLPCEQVPAADASVAEMASMLDALTARHIGEGFKYLPVHTPSR